jgi:DNA-binding beta-propeller fold protein YncE
MLRPLFALTMLLAFPLLAGETMIVAHKHADEVGFYDVDGFRLLTTVAVNRRPHELALTKNRKLLYVSDYGLERWTDDAEGGRTLSIIGVPARKKIGEIDLGRFRRPHGMEFGRSGMLYVTTDKPGALLVVDTKKKAVVRHYEVGDRLPHMVALSEDETMAFTANSGDGTVSAIPLKGGAQRVYEVGGIPMGLALSHDGKRLFVATRTGDEVLLIDTEAQKIVHRIPVSGQPVRLRFTHDEQHLIVTTIGAGDVVIINPRSLQIYHRVHIGAALEGIGLDPRGEYAYLSAQGDARVVRIAVGTWRLSGEYATGARPDPIIILPAGE